MGSRGDSQPFLFVGLRLRALGHRIRSATHLVSQMLVEQTGLKFFNVGRDLMELMAYVVKNTGLPPDIDGVIKGDIRRNRKAIQEIMEGS